MFSQLKTKAIKLGAQDFGKSKRKHKKYYVVYKKKTIHFGHSSYEDYTTHKNKERRRRYRARASKIRNGDGALTYRNKTYANFWAYHVLW